jgi:3-oxoacyl-[acyl-carrier-protein] synthase III
VHDGPPSELGLKAARSALERAGVEPARVRLIVDYSTLPGNRPALWTLSNHLQGELGCAEAVALSTQGGGCAGLHVALRTAIALMRDDPALDVALLVASDCVGTLGRCCLRCSATPPAPWCWAPVLPRGAPHRGS